MTTVAADLGLVLCAVVPGRPVSKNRRGLGPGAYGSQAHFFVTPQENEFKARCRVWIRQAAQMAGWPQDPFLVDAVRISLVKWNTKADISAGDELLFDALQYQKLRIKIYKENEPWGIYGDDRCVRRGPSDPAKDAGEARIEVKIELLELCSEHEAQRRRARWEEQQEARKQKTRDKAKVARDKAKAKREKQAKENQP